MHQSYAESSSSGMTDRLWAARSIRQRAESPPADAVRGCDTMSKDSVPHGHHLSLKAAPRRAMAASRRAPILSDTADAAAPPDAARSTAMGLSGTGFPRRSSRRGSAGAAG